MISPAQNAQIQWQPFDLWSYLLEPRSRRELAFDIPVDGEKAIGEEKPERGGPVNMIGDFFTDRKFKKKKKSMGFDAHI